MIKRIIPGTSWCIEVNPWQDGYGWRVTNSETGYTYSAAMFDSPSTAEIVALWHIVQQQAKAGSVAEGKLHS